MQKLLKSLITFILKIVNFLAPNAKDLKNIKKYGLWPWVIIFILKILAFVTITILCIYLLTLLWNIIQHMTISISWKNGK